MVSLTTTDSDANRLMRYVVLLRGLAFSDFSGVVLAQYGVGA